MDTDFDKECAKAHSGAERCRLRHITSVHEFDPPGEFLLHRILFAMHKSPPLHFLKQGTSLTNFSHIRSYKNPILLKFSVFCY